MQIIILGAGGVGSTLVEYLLQENIDITIIDTDIERLRELQNKHDIRIVEGYASHPSSLKEAGIEEADMLIAVTNSDETNIVACQIASTLYNKMNHIARIRCAEYIKEQDALFWSGALPISHFIAPETLLIDHIEQLIEFPGVLQIFHFADDISLASVKAYYGGPLVGNPLSTLTDHLPHVTVCVAAIFRQGLSIRPRGSTIIEADDEVFFITSKHYIRSVINELQHLEKPYQNIMIIGGGSVGSGLAKRIEKHYNVKLIERNQNYAERLSQSLEKTLVFSGEASDQALLVEENIDQIDACLSLTNKDETNIMSALLAKRLGAKSVFALIQRDAYVDLVPNSEIDITISPQHTTISALLTNVRSDNIINVYSLHQRSIEAMEVVVKGTREDSKVIGKTLKKLKLPSNAYVSAVVRNKKMLMPEETLEIENGDHMIIFLVNRQHIQEIERLFQPIVAK